MLGSFLQTLSDPKQERIVELSQHDKGLLLPAGLVVVAAENIVELKHTGLPSALRFGIVDDEQHVIIQQSRGATMDEPFFPICRVRLNEFCPTGWTLLTLRDEEEPGRLSDIHTRARTALGTVHQVLRSYPGDDFVTECLTGQNIAEYARNNPILGQHWWTPLQYNVTELRQLAEEATGVRIPPAIPDSFNPALLNFRHHGIAIEENWVIHFANCRVPDRCNRVKLDNLTTFCSITPYAKGGGACTYKNDTEYTRLLHRNRAVWLLFHAEEWGKYNLITNNCEHLSRMCKTGRRESAQVKKGVVSTALATASLLIPVGAALRALSAIGLPYLLNKILKHRTTLSDTPISFSEN